MPEPARLIAIYSIAVHSIAIYSIAVHSIAIYSIAVHSIAIYSFIYFSLFRFYLYVYHTSKHGRVNWLSVVSQQKHHRPPMQLLLIN